MIDTRSDFFDFKPMGSAIKAARRERKLSREEFAEICGVSSGYIKAIENTGRNPGFQVFFKMVTGLGISVDEFFYPDMEAETGTTLRNTIELLRECSQEDLHVVISMLDGLARRQIGQKV